MALLQELNEAPGGDSFANLYAKYDLLTQTINSILGGGSSGQSIRKVDGIDFNFEFYIEPKTKVLTYSMPSPMTVGSSNTFTAPNTPNDAIRTNIINFSAFASAANSAQFKIEILRGATVIKTLEAGMDSSSISTLHNKSFSYTISDVGVSPNTTYSVRLTKASSSVSIVLASLEFTITSIFN